MGPYDGVRHEPAWASGSAVVVALVAFHVAVGALVGRWWVLGLPLAWSLLSVPAEGYDVPVFVPVAFQTPVLWAPALATGVAARRLLGWYAGRGRARATPV